MIIMVGHDHTLGRRTRLSLTSGRELASAQNRQVDRLKLQALARMHGQESYCLDIVRPSRKLPELPFVAVDLKLTDVPQETELGISCLPRSRRSLLVDEL